MHFNVSVISILKDASSNSMFEKKVNGIMDTPTNNNTNATRDDFDYTKFFFVTLSNIMMNPVTRRTNSLLISNGKSLLTEASFYGSLLSIRWKINYKQGNISVKDIIF